MNYILMFIFVLVGLFCNVSIHIQAAYTMVTAEKHTYTIYSDGMPADAVVLVAGQEFRNLNAQNGQTIVAEILTESDIQVQVGEGYSAKVMLDNANYQINVIFIDDSESAFDPATAPLACATLLYAKPGAPFRHKLVANEGLTVTDVDFGCISTLTLREDRLNIGNKYKYVAGTAPEVEGEYAYTVNLKDAEGQQKQAIVRLIVSDFLQSPTPMMAWLTWNWFARSISHSKMVEIAKGMEKHGLVDAGFRTIVLDDAWANETQDKSQLNYDAAKFPYGIAGLKKAFQDINPRLKLGIYSDAGTMTCEYYQPGSFGFEAQHIDLFNSWGVDMLKYDYCNSEASTRISYSRMGTVIEALNNQRREAHSIPFVFNICEWGSSQPWLWGAEAGGSSWRATADVREDWIGNSSRPGVLAATDEVRRLWMYGGVNRFNDLDMMCIGLHGLGGPSNNTVSNKENGGAIIGLTPTQARTQMSLWCMFSSPLSLTCDLRETPMGEANSEVTMPDPLITDDDIATLTNPEIIALNQDILGQQAEYMEALSTGTTDYEGKGYDVYVKDLADGSFAVAVVNRSDNEQSSISLPLHELYMQAGRTYLWHDVWSKASFEVKDTLATGTLSPCETRVFTLRLKK